jgi:hypothetical protein
VHRPQCHELTESDVVRGVGVPEPYGEDAGVVCELDLEKALRCFVLLARSYNIVEVDNATRKGKVTRAGFEVTYIRFFVIESGLKALSFETLG